MLPEWTDLGRRCAAALLYQASDRGESRLLREYIAVHAVFDTKMSVRASWTATVESESPDSIADNHQHAAGVGK